MRKNVFRVVFGMFIHMCVCMCVCICVCICIGVSAITVSAINATTATAATAEYVDGYLRYTVEEGSVTITGYNGTENEVTIPSKIAGNPVNAIKTGAFADSSNVKKINLPDTIMTIEEGAFGGQEIVYNSNIKSQGAKATEKPGDKADTKESTAAPEKSGNDSGAEVSTDEKGKTGKVSEAEVSTDAKEKPDKDTEAEVSTTAKENSGNKADASESVSKDTNAEQNKAVDTVTTGITTTEQSQETGQEREDAKILVFVVVVCLILAVVGVCIIRKRKKG